MRKNFEKLQLQRILLNSMDGEATCKFWSIFICLFGPVDWQKWVDKLLLVLMRLLWVSLQKINLKNYEKKLPKGKIRFLSRYQKQKRNQNREVVSFIINFSKNVNHLFNENFNWSGSNFFFFLHAKFRKKAKNVKNHVIIFKKLKKKY